MLLNLVMKLLYCATVSMSANGSDFPSSFLPLAGNATHNTILYLVAQQILDKPLLCCAALLSRYHQCSSAVHLPSLFFSFPHLLLCLQICPWIPLRDPSADPSAAPGMTSSSCRLPPCCSRLRRRRNRWRRCRRRSPARCRRPC